MGAETDITEDVLVAPADGDSTSWDRLVPLVYTELRAMAHRQLQHERDSHTLNTTALVHEAFLKLANQPGIQFQNKAHFFAIAARVMRQVLIDYARYHRAAKREGGSASLELDALVPLDSGAERSAAAADDSLVADDRAELLVALDDALTRLSAVDERLVRVVECRFFGGLSEQETAAALGVTPRTVRRDWVKARAWLHRALEA